MFCTLQGSCLNWEFNLFLDFFLKWQFKYNAKKKNYIPNTVTTLTVWVYRYEYILWVNNESKKAIYEELEWFCLAAFRDQKFKLNFWQTFKEC